MVVAWQWDGAAVNVKVVWSGLVHGVSVVLGF